MNSSQKLVQCPKCPSLVRFDRLKNHLEKKCPSLVKSDEVKNHLKKVHDDQQSVVDSEEFNDESDNCVDWYACNSVDRMDGSKYIGYFRRERKDSRFGSFPIHDDYSEESSPDNNYCE